MITWNISELAPVYLPVELSFQIIYYRLPLYLACDWQILDYFSFPSWENICFADLCWNVASSLFTGNVSENAVPSRQGNSLYFIHECHLMVDLLSWDKSPVLWRIFLYIGPKERNNLSEYLHECVKVSSPVMNNVVCHPDLPSLQKLCWFCFGLVFL